MKADNDNSQRQRYETGLGNPTWVVPLFSSLTKPELEILSRPLVEFHQMVEESIEVVLACKTDKVECAVYVVSDIYGQEVKIGKATNPTYRLAQLQTGNPKKLFLHRVFWMNQQGADEVERAAHSVATRKFSRLEGEWFACSPSDAHSAVEQAIQSAPTRYCVMTPLSELWRAA